MYNSHRNQKPFFTQSSMIKNIIFFYVAAKKNNEVFVRMLTGVEEEIS